MARQIVACIDGSASTQAVCDWAAWISVELQSPLTLLHVLERSRHPSEANLTGNIGIGSRENLMEELVKLDEERSKLALAQGKNLLESAKKRVESLNGGDVTTRQRHGSLIETLTDMKDDIRLLVMGRQGSETESDYDQIGSQLESVLRTLKRPILVALPQFKEPKQVMIAYDASPTARKVLEMAARNPMMKGRPCHLVMVGGDAEALLQEGRSTLESAGHQVATAQLSGEVDAALWEYALDHAIDLLIMGAYGHSRIRQFLVGSNTTKMLHSAKIPLLFLR
ncbi:MAG: universal stress protein [Oligoflexus sp.]